MSDRKKGIINATIAYLLWGLYPIYWWQLQSVSPTEILINRMVWSFFTLFLVILFLRKFKELSFLFKELFLNKKRLFLLFLATVLIVINWFTYSFSVVNGRILEASLGYYLSPILSFIIGVFILKEKLNKLQILAVLIAFLGVLFQIISYGIFPWISLILASSFAFYGLCKKLIKVDAFFSLFIETIFMLPISLFFFSRLFTTNESTFLLGDVSLTLLLIGTGLVTILPLFFFGKATQLVPLKIIGFLQYIGPTMGMFIAVFILGEDFSITRLISFVIIWIACIIFAFSQFRVK